MINLSEFVVGDNVDFTYNDPPLIHRPCGEVLCTVEAGDELEVLVLLAQDHADECAALTRVG